MKILFFILLQLDPGYCGAFGVETGPLDPFWKSACKQHDEAMTKQKEYRQEQSNLKIQAEFIEAIAKTTVKEVAEGVYALVFAIPFALLGGGVGGFLMAKRKYTKKVSGGSSGHFETE